MFYKKINIRIYHLNQDKLMFRADEATTMCEQLSKIN